MLGLDIGRAKLAGLIPREEDHAPCLLCVAFEHDILPRSGLSAGVTVRCVSRPRSSPRAPFSLLRRRRPNGKLPRSDRLFWMVLGLLESRQPESASGNPAFHPVVSGLNYRPKTPIPTLCGLPGENTLANRLLIRLNRHGKRCTSVQWFRVNLPPAKRPLMRATFRFPTAGFVCTVRPIPNCVSPGSTSSCGSRAGLQANQKPSRQLCPQGR